MNSIQKLCLLLCLLFSTNTFSKTPLIRMSLFQRELTKKSTVGWIESKGGRSWELGDYRRFNKFIQEVSSNNTGLNILRKWGIPHDCFDAIISLHFIFSLKNGLAINYGDKSISINHFENPMRLLQNALIRYGTFNAKDILYPVDIFVKENIQSGLIYVYGGSPGHAQFLVSEKDNGLFSTIEGPFPAAHAQLNKSIFFKSSWVERSSFRRFPLYHRIGNQVISFIAPSFAAGSVQDQIQYFTNGDALWYNLINLVLTKKFPTKDLIKNFKKSFCGKISQRIERVNRGITQCNKKIDPDKKACSAGKNAMFSTPGFDSIFNDLTFVWSIIVDDQSFTIPLIKCNSLDFEQGLMGKQRKRGLEFFINNRLNERELSPNIKIFSTDPMDPISSRWGVKKLNFVGTENKNYRFEETLSLSSFITVSITKNGVKIRRKNNGTTSSKIKNIIIEDDLGEYRRVISIENISTQGISIKVNLPRDSMLNFIAGDQYEEGFGSGFSIMYR